LTVDASNLSWTSRIEAAIRTLRDVEAVAVRADGQTVREIHVVTSSTRRPNLLVRDIQTLLLTRFQRAIDRRVVSVVCVAPGREPGDRPAYAPEVAHEAPAPEAHEDVPPAADERIRFGGVNLYVAGTRAQAQVELRWKGVPRMGSASGWGTRDGSHRLIATATLNAVQGFIDEEVALGVADVDFVDVGRRSVAVVGLTLLVHRQEKLLVGSCAVEQDAQRSVVLATLAALNRVVGGLRTKEPTEYVLRPASVREESGASRSR
jgi:hypothetical protein